MLANIFIYVYDKFRPKYKMTLQLTGSATLQATNTS